MVGGMLHCMQSYVGCSHVGTLRSRPLNTTRSPTPVTRYKMESQLFFSKEYIPIMPIFSSSPFLVIMFYGVILNHCWNKNFDYMFPHLHNSLWDSTIDFCNNATFTREVHYYKHLLKLSSLHSYFIPFSADADAIN